MGILLFIAGTVLLWWNEGRTVKTGDMLDEAREVCKEMVNPEKKDAALDGELVCGSAMAMMPIVSDRQTFSMAEGMVEAGPPKYRLTQRDPLMACSLSMRMEARFIFHKATCNTKPRPKLGASAIHGILSEARMALQAITLMVSLGLVPLRKAITVLPQILIRDGLTCFHGAPVVGVVA